MSVIVSRALPDVRDGLKPVHRRVVYAMYDGGYRPDRGFNKCSRVVGDVMGQYHPHGDASIYDALVRLVQDWSLRYPLVAGPGQLRLPAATTRPPRPRYTECRMAPLAMEMVRDIDEETVDFARQLRRQDPGADGPAGALPEPARQRLGRHRGRHGHPDPAAQPARGRRRPPQWLLEHPEASRARSCSRPSWREIKGPDFPTGALIMGRQRHRGRLPHRPRLDHHARGRRGRGDPGPAVPRRHRAALPGQPRQPRAEDRRARQGRPARRHRRHPRRDLRPHRPAPGHRAASATPSPRSCSTTSTSTPSCRPTSAPTCSRSSTACRARCRSTRSSGTGSTTRSTSSSGARPTGCARPRSASTSCAATQGARRARRGHRPHPPLADGRGRARRADRAPRDRRDPGPGDPRHAAAPARRPGAPEDHRRARRARSARSRTTATSSPSPSASATIVSERARRDRRQVRRRAPHRDRRRSTATCRWRTSSPRRTSSSRSPAAATPSAPGSTPTARSGAAARACAGRRCAARTWSTHFFTTTSHHWLLFFTNLGRVYRAKAYELPDGGRDAKGQHVANLLAFQPDEQIAQVLDDRATTSRRPTSCSPPGTAWSRRPACAEYDSPRSRRPHRRQPARRRRARRRRPGRRPTTTCCSCRARASRCASTPTTRRCGRWAARPPASPA